MPEQHREGFPEGREPLAHSEAIPLAGDVYDNGAGRITPPYPEREFDESGTPVTENAGEEHGYLTGATVAE